MTPCVRVFVEAETESAKPGAFVSTYSRSLVECSPQKASAGGWIPSVVTGGVYRFGTFARIASFSMLS
jgi:hypothetical protein